MIVCVYYCSTYYKAVREGIVITKVEMVPTILMMMPLICSYRNKNEFQS